MLLWGLDPREASSGWPMPIVHFFSLPSHNQRKPVSFSDPLFYIYPLSCLGEPGFAASCERCRTLGPSRFPLIRSLSLAGHRPRPSLLRSPEISFLIITWLHAHRHRSHPCFLRILLKFLGINLCLRPPLIRSSAEGLLHLSSQPRYSSVPSFYSVPSQYIFLRVALRLFFCPEWGSRSPSSDPPSVPSSIRTTGAASLSTLGNGPPNMDTVALSSFSSWFWARFILKMASLVSFLVPLFSSHADWAFYPSPFSALPLGDDLHRSV